MIKLSGIGKSFGGQTIFRKIDWFVRPRDRVALIGENGSGKTTLLRMIAGLESPDTGTIDLPRSLRIGYLAQTGFVVGTGTVRAEARRAFDEVLAIEAEMRRVEARLDRVRPGDEDIDSLTHRHAELHERLHILGADDIERLTAQVLLGLGFRQADFDRTVTDLSGGWQMRAALARILLTRPEALLLDEPTNHLDLEAREWLEGYLRDYPYAVALVSHDRYFLDQTVQRVTEIVGQGLEEYAGNYSYYEGEREKRLALRIKAYEKQQDEIRHMQRFIDKYRSDKRRASLVQSRLKTLAKMDRLELPREYRRTISIRLPDSARLGKIALELRGVHKSYGEITVFSGLDFRVLRGRRIALVGPNGAGKSTLMRLLAGQEEPDRGERIAGYQLETAFFAQEQGFRLERKNTVYETVTALAPVNFIPQVRGLLGAFLFSGDSVDKKVAVLSGGEQNRLALACLLVRPSNLLLLDEPTNHLDLMSKEVLLEALRGFAGTVVFVSHDRHFLEALATHVVEVGGGGVREYPGTYGEYIWAREHGALAARVGGEGERGATRAAARGATATAAITSDAAPSRVNRTRAASSAAGTSGEMHIARLEARIAELEERRKRYADAMSAPGFFANESRARVYQEQYRDTEDELSRLYEEWERQNGTQ